MKLLNRQNKMNKKIKVTIGIPVFNEEANIGILLGDLLKQDCGEFLINEIIVSSDGSSDRTLEAVRKIKSGRIRVIENKDRKGIARGLNQILREAKGDVLVTLDGDIRIKDRKFILRLIKPIMKSGADLTSSAIAEVKPVSQIAKTLFVSMKLKRILFDNLEKADNIYTCHGLARAYSRKFYINLHFPVSVGNDMYSYLACRAGGFKYVYARDAVAWYRLPETYKDHTKQSLRFFVSASEQSLYFGSKLIAQEIEIPTRVYMISVIKGLRTIVMHPSEVVMYFWIQLRLRRESKNHEAKQIWETAETSKVI